MTVEFEDPIHKKNGKWFFWDECWAFEEGPYDSEEEARKELDIYFEVMRL